ncbi:tripartite-type tricarboxylate transporter receptor subunit TctC [Humitalea rosea]|uniref:Tripartite-type tricarboxylate transporter receptor subunit TctC n=1 Tax=Humitalea rosea TaxID=990373 RepID=A0A2W7I9H8_9PROT|nr:tripartite tricarboxylate transporter substrate binding protein [Humitalea rosea]PZW43556.1 tripartite-type tricarboxylate transporter receptor subunit TctC [Humitalea rosea]
MTAKLHRRTLGAAALAGLALPGSLRAQGTDWPNQPVRLIVPFAAGGPTDIPARLIAERMSNTLPQRVIVENRTGAGVIVGSEVVAKAPKDGYTLLYNTVAHSVLSALFARLPFDPVADFKPVALVGVIPMVIAVNKDFPATTLAELVAVLRANPNRYDYASSGNGGALHLATELFLKTAGVQANHVPYRGSAAAMPDVMSGRVPIIVDVAASALPYIDRGELRGIAVMNDSRMPQLPAVPTTAEAGMPGLTASTWHMVLAPAGTPAAVVAKVNAEVNKVLAMPEVERRLTELAMQVNSTSTPDSATAWLASETEKWTRIVREADIKAN